MFESRIIVLEKYCNGKIIPTNVWYKNIMNYSCNIRIISIYYTDFMGEDLILILEIITIQKIIIVGLIILLNLILKVL